MSLCSFLSSSVVQVVTFTVRNDIGLNKSYLHILAAHSIFIRHLVAMVPSTPSSSLFCPALSAASSSMNGVIAGLNCCHFGPANVLYVSTHCNRNPDMLYSITLTVPKSSFFLTCMISSLTLLLLALSACLSLLFSISDSESGSISICSSTNLLYGTVYSVCSHPRNLPLSCGSSIFNPRFMSSQASFIFCCGPLILKSST